ncbi:hypothetical protein [Lacunimicrobium album]
MLMVISLLTALAFLGFFFFAFVSADRDSASWFSSQLQVARQDEDPYFDFALEQLILGPKQEYTNSALYGGKHALVPNMIGNLDIFDAAGEFDFNSDTVIDPWEDLNGNGALDPPGSRNGDSQQVTDLHPYNGRGVRLVYDMDANGHPVDIDGDGLIDNLGFDYDGDGIDDTLVMNYSAGANAWTGRILQDAHTLMSPDVDYTYPDINNTYLAHMTWVPVQNGGEIYKPVWIPSFHRPQYLQEWRQGTTVTNPWEYGPYLSKVLHPHRGQAASYWDTQGDADPSNDQVVKVGPRFTGSSFFIAPQEGIWKDLNTDRFDDYEYDIDADGDGVKEAIYVDLDYPVETFDGIDFIPVFGFTVLDSEGLINLNATGNLNHIKEDIVNNVNAPTLLPRTIIGNVSLANDHFFSASNQAYSTFEINPARALFATPDRHNPSASPLADVFAPYYGMFGTPMSASSTVFQLANYDLFRMIAGAPKFTRDDQIIAKDVDPGRYGEGTNLAYDLYGQGNLETKVPFPTGPLNATTREYLFSNIFSQAGGTRSPNPDASAYTSLDDDNDRLTGAGQGQLASSIFNGLSSPPSVHPVDVLGIGNVLDLEYGQYGTSGATRRLFEDTTLRAQPLFTDATKTIKNPSIWPHYQGTWQGIGLIEPYTITPWSIMDTAIEDDPRFDDIQNIEGLIQGTSTRLLFNEDDEITLEPDFLDQSRDSVFSVAEMEGLHFADGDYNRPELAVVSRLRKLLSFNFEDYEEDTSNDFDGAAAIRKQFTTVGWDRREFSFFPISPTPVYYDHDGDPITPAVLWMNRSWEFNLDIANPAYSTRQTSPTDTNRDYRGKFPPAFGLTLSQRTMSGTATYPAALPFGNEDPFRATTRRWLGIEQGRTDFTNPLPQRKLLTGQVLDYDTEKQQIRFRPLTPHPVFQAGDANSELVLLEHGNAAEQNPALLTYQYADIGFNTTSSRLAQEWWARYDRQRMARDIYVLLYTMCGPDDLNPTVDAYGTDAGAVDLDGDAIDDRVKKMAQFAVNFVDFIDPDDCITRFEYDTDLSDGWQFDPLTINTPNETSRVVYGVEAQSLTFSEAQWIFQLNKDTPGNNNFSYDDDMEDRHYLFMELCNALPKYVDLRNGSWRIRRLKVLKNNTPGTEVEERRLYFAAGNLTSDTGRYEQVAPGGLYTIGTHDSTKVATSDSKVISSAYRAIYDAAATTLYKLVSPVRTWNGAADAGVADANTGAASVCHLDLAHGTSGSVDHRNQFVVTNPANDDLSATAGPNGKFFNPGDGFFGPRSDAIADEAVVTFVLERRQNLNHAYSPTAGRSDTTAGGGGGNVGDYGDGNDGWIADDSHAWNEWVEVDRMSVTRGLVDMDPDPTTADAMQDKVKSLRSMERREPLYASHAPVPSAPGNLGETIHPAAAASGVTAPDQQANTIGDVNFNTPGLVGNKAFTTWQPHFDRDMTSVMEAASVPLFGPTPLTEPITSNWIGGTSHAMVTPIHDPAPDIAGKLSDLNIASRWFFNPKGLPNEDGIAAFNVPQNRWYRLFEFFEVEPKIHQSITNLLSISRTPGRINLNTTRALTGPGTHPTITTAHPQAGYLSGLAALIDDESHLSMTDFNLIDSLENTRDWGKQFRIARDGYDPLWRFNSSVNISLPGSVGSKPFRSLGFLDSNPPMTGGSYIPSDESIEHTILRRMPFDAFSDANLAVDDNANADTHLRRPLFEARTYDDFSSTDQVFGDNVDYHTRNRLLAKIDNNSTTVSNVFYVFIALDFFRAAPAGAGGESWSIGEKLTDDTSLSAEAQEKFKKRRGFFVVDRSLLEKAYDPTTGRIDFRKLILHRRKLEPYN